MPQLLDALPPIYRQLLGAPDSPMHQEVPAESKATCASCAMLEANCPDAPPPVDGRSRFFLPATKCCTFHPRLPNYLVGGVLDDATPAGAEGRRRMEARVASRVGVTPEWLEPPRAFSLLYDNAYGAFGKARALRCPFYEEGSGGCTVWAHRDAVCSTYYCKYVTGEDGRRMWTAVKELVSLVEIQLARAALLELAPELLDLAGGVQARKGAAPLGPEDVDGAAPAPAAHAARWGTWAGREAELFRACSRWVRARSAAEVEAILGLDGRIARRAVERALRAASDATLPPVLRLDPGVTVSWLPDGSVALAGYSPLEALVLPGSAYPLLARFTGAEPVAQVRARLRAELHADLADEVLLELYRHRILAPPPSPPPAASPAGAPA